MENIEASAGLGLGHYFEKCFFDDALSLSGGCKYDLVSIKYSDGTWRTGQGFYSGLEASLVGLFSAGDGTTLYRKNPTDLWVEESSDGVFVIWSSGIYIFGGASYSIGIHVNNLCEDLSEIFN